MLPLYYLRIADDEKVTHRGQVIEQIGDWWLISVREHGVDSLVLVQVEHLASFVMFYSEDDRDQWLRGFRGRQTGEGLRDSVQTFDENA